MTKYRVCLYVVERTANYISIEADTEEAAIAAAQNEWYAYGQNAFSSICLEEETEEITATKEAQS